MTGATSANLSLIDQGEHSCAADELHYRDLGTALVKALELGGGNVISQRRQVAFAEHLEDAAVGIHARMSTAGMASTRRVDAMDAVEKGT